jgi:hypothetical protein
VNSDQCSTVTLADGGSCVWVNKGLGTAAANERCVEVKDTCNIIEEGDVCETTGAAKTSESGSGSESGGCFWIYKYDDNDVGICSSKMNESLVCNDVIRENQCKNGLSDTFLNEKCIFYNEECISRCEILEINSCNIRSNDCIWIYSDNDDDNNDGSCYAKNDTDIKCDTFHRDSQCVNGGDIDRLNNKCIIIENSNGEWDYCKDKVCIYTYILILFNNNKFKFYIIIITVCYLYCYCLFVGVCLLLLLFLILLLLFVIVVFIIIIFVM